MLLIAVPVQSQTPTRLTNPTTAELGACGLPTTWAQFDADATVTTFNMTADCAFSSSNVGSGAAFLYFSAGEFTINGNGYSIIGPSNTWTIFVQNAGTILNLHNVTIRGNNGSTVFSVTSGARLNARRVTFRDNTTSAGILAITASEGQLEDMQFLNNTVSSSGSSILAVGNSGATPTLTNGIFTGNTVSNGTIININDAASFSGSGITFSDNSARSVMFANALNTQATVRNVQFLNSIQTSFTEQRGSAFTSFSQSAVIINNGIFRGNRNVAGQTNVIVSLGSTGNEGTVELQGCVTFEGNVQSDGTAANDYGAYDGNGPVSLTGLITDSRTGVCPAGIGFISWLSQGQKKKPKKAEPTPTATSTPRPAYGASYVALQTATGMTFEATYGLDSGVHFRQLDGAGIGIQSIIDAGYLAALDVYGYVEQGVEVCFPQIGRVIFLDARTMPRAIVLLEATVRDGMTCASISSPGSLVLMPN